MENTSQVSNQVTSNKDQVTKIETSAVVDPLLNNSVQPEDLDAQWARWKCLVCGFVYEGRQSLHKCPKCGNEDPDKFEDAD